MIDIIGKKKYYFLISLILIIPGLISLVLFGLNLSIDFRGGSKMSLLFEKQADQNTINQIREDLESQKIKVSTIEKSNKLVVVRTSNIDQKQNNEFLKTLNKDYKNVK
ncbi:MAG: hypothetical protein AAB922_07165, partial [Patescibacteria group bacterium]